MVPKDRGARGVAVASPEAAPATSLCARTWKVWSVSFVRPVTVWLVVSVVLPVMSVQAP